jgi:hypothetical protein
VLLTIIVYAYDEMSYEVESREQLRGVRRLGFQTLGLNFGDVTHGWTCIGACSHVRKSRRSGLLRVLRGVVGRGRARVKQSSPEAGVVLG